VFDSMFRYLIPLIIFIVLVAFFAHGLQRDPSLVPSPLIDKPLPEFSLPLLQSPESVMTSGDLGGEVTLLNVWASWCVACRHEHPVLMKLARQGTVRIVGLDYKDKREAALQWLDRYGNPYTASFFDESGEVGIDLGVYGVPETYILDRNGVIRYKHVGPVTEEVLEETVLPILERLRREETS